MLFSKDYLKQFYTILGPFLIILGYFKLHFYYINYNIRIADYLEFTEILTLILDDIGIVFLALVVAFLSRFFIYSYLDNSRSDKLSEKFKKKTNFLKRIIIQIKLNIYLVIFTILTTIVMFICRFWFFEVYAKFWLFFLIGPAFILYIFALHEFSYLYHKKYGEGPDNNITNTIGIFFLTAGMVLIQVPSNIKKTNGPSSREICFEYENTTIKTDEKLKYLGKSKNYIFLYDSANLRAKVFERSLVRFYTVIDSDITN